LTVEEQILKYIQVFFHLLSTNRNRVLSSEEVFNGLASDTSGANDDIVVPESVSIATVGFPTEVNGRDLGHEAAPRPLAGVGVRGALLDGQTGDGGVVQPGFEGAVGAQVVLKAIPATRGKGGRGGDPLRGKVGQRRVVGLPVVHEDLALPADAQVLLGTLRRVGHGDEGDVGVGEGLGGFSIFPRRRVLC